MVKVLETRKAAILAELLDLECQMSPERITGDGEWGRMSDPHIQRELKGLEKQKADLVRQFRSVMLLLEGDFRDPTWDEIWSA